MKKILMILGIGILGLILLVLIIPIFVSKSYTVEESIVINAPKSMVYDYISDFNNFNEWSPWQDRDPEMVTTITGDGKSVGSKYEWEGDNEAGKGSMEIIEMDEHKINIDLRFVEPFESESFTQYRFEETESGTKLIWYMEGEMPYPMNLLNLFSIMEKAIGADYRKGLESAKSKLEGRFSLGGSNFSIEEIDFPTTTFLGMKKRVPFSEMEEFFASAYDQIFRNLEELGVKEKGIPSALYFIWDEVNMEAEIGVSLAFEGSIPDFSGSKLTKWEFSGSAFRIVYKGNYDKLDKVHGALHDHLDNLGENLQSPSIEKYIIGPANDSNSENWITHVYYFLENQ
ncbi:MAG: hypothetical protein EA362_08695 [Saprospirales bacterium]|nr:MAG: hypothetical protein EA362_08695 [Saprospirales bacterium]